MQVSQLVGSADGVEAALVAMATDINLDLARDMGFTVSDATADDLLIAVRATDVAALDLAVELAEQQLAARPLVGRRAERTKCRPEPSAASPDTSDPPSH